MQHKSKQVKVQYSTPSLLNKLFKKRADLEMMLIEDAEKHLPAVIESLRNKALEGDLRAQDLYIYIVFERLNKIGLTETSATSVNNYSMEDLMRFQEAWYMSQEGKKEKIIEHTPIKESQSENFPPPPFEMAKGTSPGISEIENPKAPSIVTPSIEDISYNEIKSIVEHINNQEKPNE